MTVPEPGFEFGCCRVPARPGEFNELHHRLRFRVTCVRRVLTGPAMFDQENESLEQVAAALAALTGIVLGDHSLDAVLTRTCEVTKQTIRGAADASVTLIDDVPRTVAFSGDVALSLDERQYEVGYGPCLDAARLHQTVVLPDAATETRWPNYTPKVIEAGLIGSISVPLSVDGTTIGALNTYFKSSDGLDVEGVAVAETLAQYASIVLHNADLYFSATSRAGQMQEAMVSRAVIEQAKGILIGQRQCTAEEAFDLLVRLSQQSHRKLRAVAEALVASALPSA